MFFLFVVQKKKGVRKEKRFDYGIKKQGREVTLCFRYGNRGEVSRKDNSLVNETEVV